MSVAFGKSWLAAALICWLSSCAGTKKLIQQAQAFIVTPQQGTVRVDEKGNEVSALPTPVIVVYVHCQSDKVTWDSAWLGNKAYPVVQQRITQPVEMGVDKRTGEKISISPGEGSYLFQLQISPRLAAGEEWPVSVRIRAGYRNKTLYRDVMPIRSVQTPDAQ